MLSRIRIDSGLTQIINSQTILKKEIRAQAEKSVHDFLGKC